MKQTLFTLCALVGAVLSIAAQDLHVLDYLRRTSKTGIVLPRNQLPSTNEHSVTSAMQWLNKLENGQIHSKSRTIPTASALQSSMAAIQQTTGLVPIGFTLLSYESCDLSTISQGNWRPTLNEAVLNGVESIPLELHHTTFAFTDLEVEVGDILRAIVPSSLTFTSSYSLITQLEIQEPLSGNWKKIKCDSPFEIAMGTEDQLRFRYMYNDEFIYFSLSVTRAMCVSAFPDPDPNVPWQFLDDSPQNISPWEISTVTQDGSIVSGNAYYLPSGTFDKPFIFVEGIDFSYYHDPMRNGSFGWCQFTSGTNDPLQDYWFLFNLRPLLTSLREQGFDIILLDFFDGAGDITKSSALTQHLLRMVNASKVGDHPNVLSGASMGGIVTRHALCSMESQQENHCTSLWISLDAPHSGANIPLALQQMIYHLSGQPQAATFIHDMLARPAARQLLHIQYHPFYSDTEVFSPSSHVAFFDALNHLGFPSQCKSIGITNGSLKGKPLWGNELHYLMNEDCELSGCSDGPESRFFMTGTQGDPGYSDLFITSPNTEQPLCSQFVRSSPVAWQDVAIEAALNGLFSAYQLYACDFPKTIQIARTRAGTPNFDRMSGGTRTSIDDLAYAINNSSVLQDAGCTQVSIYIPVHSFIATYSGLAMPFSVEEPSVYERLLNEPSLSPFDRILGPVYDNEPHSFVSEASKVAILEEALALSQFDSFNELTQFSPNGGWFNMGDPSLTKVPNTAIHNDGRLTINHEGFVHFGEQPENFTFPGSHFHAYIFGDCLGEGVVVKSGGILSVGAEDASRYSTLHVRKGGSLTIEHGGRFTINPGSTLLIENGGIVKLYNGSINHVRGENQHTGTIILRPGGTLELNSAQLSLLGDHTELRMEGGRINIIDGNCEISGIDQSCGQILCRTANENEIFVASNSTLTLRGQNELDNILEINTGKLLNLLGSGLTRIMHAGVRMEGGSELYTTNNLVSVQSKWFEPLTEYAVLPAVRAHGAQTSILSSHSEGIKWFLRDSFLKISLSNFSGYLSSIELESGKYEFIQSTFNQTPVSAVNMIESNRSIGCGYYYSASSTALYDAGAGSLFLKDNEFQHAQTAIEKNDGSVRMACNTIQHCGIGLHAQHGCFVEMGNTRNSGKNHFSQNTMHIVLMNAGGFSAIGGANHFAEFEDRPIYGTINMNCAGNCTPTLLPCSGNYWGHLTPTLTSLMQASVPQTLVQSSSDIQWGCNNPGQFSATNCRIYITDFNPLPEPVDCSEDDISHNPGSIRNSSELHDTEPMECRVFPNPTTARLHIQHPFHFITGIEVLDMMGRLLHQESLTHAGQSIEWEFPSDLSTGWYMLKIHHSQGSQVFPVSLSR